MWKTGEKETGRDRGKTENLWRLRRERISRRHANSLFLKKYDDCYPCHQAFWTHSYFLFLNLGVKIFKLFPSSSLRIRPII